jgi:O-antigen/teichoic acid export membrane protein
VQLSPRHIARNVVLNWVGTLANMAVGFFLAPFILHRLGDIGYGIWILAISTIGYLSLLDLGMQSAVLRFVSKGHTQGDHDAASEALSGALWVRLQISALVLLISAGIAAVFPIMFRVPTGLASDARVAVLIIGLNSAITMSIGVVAGVLSALNRYDLQNYVMLIQTAIRVIGVVSVLRSGHGIVAIAVVELCTVLVGNALLVWIAYRIYPQLRIYLTKPSKQTLKRIWAYSSYAFLTSIAVRLVYQTDNLVVGSFISAAAVAVYSFGNSLCRYVDLVVNSMGTTFVPAASTYEAAGDTESLVTLYRNGTRATLLLSLPIMITLLLRGPSFIGLWVGQQYARDAGGVLRILAFALMIAFANRTSSSIAFGIEKHKKVALFAIGEGISNLLLSILLVRWFGIYGVAIGTLIPSLFVHLILWPSYASQLIGLSRGEIFFRIWGPMFLASIPFALATYFVEDIYPAHHLVTFFLQVLATLLVFFASVAFVFRRYVRLQLLPRVRTFFINEVRA